MTLSNDGNDQLDTVSIDALMEFIKAWRRKHALCPICGEQGKRYDTNYKGKVRYECVNHRCKRSIFNEE